MKWLIDTTGRFKWRPYYNQEELDNECEQIVSNFLTKKYGAIRFPLSTDDLAVLVERDTSDLDLFADLSHDGEDVEGTTDFFPKKKPAVRIARELSLDSSKQQRLRTTLAHEYGHVRFHNFLWSLNTPQKPAVSMTQKLSSQRKTISRLRQKLNTEQANEYSNTKTYILTLVASRKTFGCLQGHIIQAPESDWMEWQASYVCGAILLPLSVIRSLARESTYAWDSINSIQADSVHAHELLDHVAHTFDVSTDAAQIRLQKLGILK
jgi:hypothetical protein